MYSYPFRYFPIHLDSIRSDQRSAPISRFHFELFLDRPLNDAVNVPTQCACATVRRMPHSHPPAPRHNQSSSVHLGNPPAITPTNRYPSIPCGRVQVSRSEAGGSEGISDHGPMVMRNDIDRTGRWIHSRTKIK